MQTAGGWILPRRPPPQSDTNPPPPPPQLDPPPPQLAGGVLNPTGTALPLDAIERIASRCCGQETVFLLDENQFVRPDEVGRTALFEAAAQEHGARLRKYDLATQFRCGGFLAAGVSGPANDRMQRRAARSDSSPAVAAE